MGIKWNPLSSFFSSDEEERLNPLNFILDCYRTKYLRITYGHTLIPINGEGIWKQASGVDVKAPVFPTKKKGNLKFKRRLKLEETTTKQVGKVSKCDMKMHCSNFRGESHNKKTCT